MFFFYSIYLGKKISWWEQPNMIDKISM